MASSKRRKNKKLHQRRRKQRRTGAPARPPTPTARPHAHPIREPTELDQIGAFFAEPDLDLEETDLASLRSMAQELPFEPAMLALSRLNLEVEPLLKDPEGQWRLAQGFYHGDPDLLSRYAKERAAAPDCLVFSPQAITLLMRVLIEEAKDASLRDLNSDEIGQLQRAVLGAHSALASSLDALPMRERESFLAYELQAATFFHRPPPLEEMARHDEFLRLATGDARLAASANRVPVREWLSAVGATADEQWAVGYALAAMTDAFGESTTPLVLAEHVADLLHKLGADHLSNGVPFISANREEFRLAFARFGGGQEAFAWELRPFKNAPFLRLGNCNLVLLGGPWLLSWLGEGFHYRAMTHAQQVEGAAESLRYTHYMGEVVELYALDLAEAAISPLARVLGEQPYGKGEGQRTTDVAVVWGRDLILFEIHARRVAAAAAVSGSAVEATTEVSKLLVKKVDQVGSCLTAVLDGQALLPDVDIDQVERIWPLVVSVGYVMQTQNLWTYLRDAIDPGKTKSLSGEKVQPLQVLDIGDYEKLMGLVASGNDLPSMLAWKASGPFRERDLTAWLHGDAEAPSDKPRHPALEARWEAMGNRVTEIFQRIKEEDRSS